MTQGSEQAPGILRAVALGNADAVSEAPTATRADQSAGAAGIDLVRCAVRHLVCPPSRFEVGFGGLGAQDGEDPRAVVINELAPCDE